MKFFKETINRWCTTGIKFPFAHDATTGKPSITLFFPYVTGFISIVSVIALHFKLDLVIASLTCIVFWLIAMILYMLRRISKAKFDLDDKSFELDSDSEKE